MYNNTPHKTQNITTTNNTTTNKTAIASVMYSILFHSNLWENPNTKRRILIFACINYIISFTVSIIPWIGIDFNNAFEPLGEWCWIGKKNSTEKTLRWTSYYMWLLFVFLSVCILYTLMYIKIRQIDFQSKKESRSNQMFDRIKWYPMVLIICFTVAVIRRLLETISNDINIPFVIVFFHVFLSSLYGFGNAIVYGLTPRVKKEWKKWISTMKENIFGVNIMKGGTVGNQNTGKKTHDIEMEDSDDDGNDDNRKSVVSKTHSTY